MSRTERLSGSVLLLVLLLRLLLPLLLFFMIWTIECEEVQEKSSIVDMLELMQFGGKRPLSDFYLSWCHGAHCKRVSMQTTHSRSWPVPTSISLKQLCTSTKVPQYKRLVGTSSPSNSRATFQILHPPKEAYPALQIQFSKSAIASVKLRSFGHIIDKHPNAIHELHPL